MKAFYLLLNSVVALTMALLGIVTLINDAKNSRNRLFFLFTISVSVWVLACYVSNDVSYTAQVSLYGNYLVFLFSYLSSVFLLWIVVALTDDTKAKHILHILTVPMILIAVVAASPLVVAGVSRQGDVYAVTFGPLVAVYAIALLGALISALFLLRKHTKVKTGQLGMQIRLLYNSMAIAVPILVATQFIVPILTGSFEITDIGLMAITIPVASFYYGVVRHRLFDIRLVAVRSVAYGLVIITMAVLYFGLAYVASLTLFKDNVTTGISVSPVNVILALVLAFVFQPIKRFFDRVTNRIFFRDQYDTNEFITELGRILTSTTQLHTVLESAGKEIKTTLKASGTMFLVFRDHHPNVVVGSGIKDHFTNDEYTMFKNAQMFHEGQVLIVAELEHSRSIAEERLYAALAKRNVALVLPLVGSSETIGYLMLGEQQGGGYGKRDIAVLETIADELVIAIQNARSVQVVRDLNTHLEERVNMATKELRLSNTRLRELDATKDEFLSMASHQLRTPLTSVKGYISMVLEGDAGKISESQRQLLGEAFTSSERMVHLISDFLNVSRLQTGKFVIEHQKSDLAEIIGQEVESITQLAGGHNIKISYKSPKRFPILYLDDSKIRQVIMNFLDNAIYYSPESKRIEVSLAVEDGDAVLRVVDQGMGVPPDVQKRLFTKFFRAENARTQRPDGTGIGLYLAKKVIDGHDGTLVFESTLGKGSTFGFRLPIKKLSTPPRNEKPPA